MKKVLIGLFLIISVVATGCLGSAPEQILGTWRYVPVNPVGHDMAWTFQDNGQCYFYNNTTATADTGAYEMYASGTHRIVKIKNTTITDNGLKMNGEWYIVSIDFDKMILGTKDQGGFQQRDFVKQ
jgi:hypothetical protein